MWKTGIEPETLPSMLRVPFLRLFPQTDSEGIEPPSMVLETIVLPLYEEPMCS